MKRVLYFGFSAILIAYWVMMTFLFNNRLSFSVMSYPQPFESEQVIPDKPLLKNDTVTLEFAAKENHLGIIYVRFNKPEMTAFEREDRLAFRLKSKESGKIIEEGIIRSGLIRKVPFIPFGFTPIDTSKHQTYILEIESLFGDGENSVSFSNYEPRLVTAYKFSREEITSSVPQFLTFMFERNIQYFSSFRSLELLSVLLIYLIPFITLWIFKSSKKSVVPYKESVSICLVFFTSFFYTYFVTLDEIPVVVLFQTFIVWIFLIWVYHLGRNISLMVSIVWMIAAVIALVIYPTPNIFAQKSSVWFYLFLVVGVAQSFIEEIRTKNKKLSTSARKGAVE